jgi:hypothetical protein
MYGALLPTSPISLSTAPFISSCTFYSQGFRLTPTTVAFFIEHLMEEKAGSKMAVQF